MARGPLKNSANSLLDDIKRYLDITWEDARTDQKLTELIDDGKAYLDDKRGAPGDYESPGYPRMLLKEYVRYARDAALDVFENNYQSMILAMQNQKGVQDYADSLESAEEA